MSYLSTGLHNTGLGIFYQARIIMDGATVAIIV